MSSTSAIKDIIAIVPDCVNAQPLEKTTIKVIRENGSGPFPYRYALINNNGDNFTIELDYTPGATFDAEAAPNERLLVHYYPNYRILSDEDDYTEFSDYSEANMKDGHWKLPSDWHRLIVMGAIAMLYPEAMAEWEKQCEIKSRDKFINSGLKLKTNLGISSGSAGKANQRSFR